MPDITDIASIATTMQSLLGSTAQPRPALPDPPQVVAPQPAHQPAHGGAIDSPYGEVMPTSPMQMLYNMIDMIDSVPFVPNGQQLVRNVRNAQDYGGFFDTFTDLIGNGGQQIVSAVGGATKSALNSLARTVENVAKYSADNRVKINSQQASLAGLRDYISDTTRRVNGLTNDWDARFGEEGRTYRAALAAAQSIPGLRAADTLTGTHYQQVLKSQGEIADKAKDLDSYVPVSAPAWGAYGAGVPADTQAAISELRAELASLIVAVNNRFDPVYDVFEVAGHEDHRDAIAGLKTQTANDTIGTLARLSPSQIVDKNEAITETIIKVLVGKAPGSTGSILSGLGF